MVEEKQKIEGAKTRRFFSDEEARSVYEESTKRVEGRFFSDEESRRVYEESIKRVEGQKDYKSGKQYKIKKVLKEKAEDKKVNRLADEIKSMLQSPESAKKAIILSEILNRRY